MACGIVTGLACVVFKEIMRSIAAVKRQVLRVVQIMVCLGNFRTERLNFQFMNTEKSSTFYARPVPKHSIYIVFQRYILLLSANAHQSHFPTS